MGATGTKKSAPVTIPPAPKKTTPQDEFGGHLGERSTETPKERMTRLLTEMTNTEVRDLLNPTNNKVNCALCSTALALYIRGYDVEAMPRDKKWRGFDSVFNVDYNNIDNYIDDGKTGLTGKMSGKLTDLAWNDAGNPGKYLPANRHHFKKGAHAVTDQIVKQMHDWGDGAVAVLNVHWKNSNSGHAIGVVNHDGDVVFFDAQSGVRTHNKDRFEKNVMSRTIANNTQLIRVDNAPVKNRFSGSHPDYSNLDLMVKKQSK